MQPSYLFFKLGSKLISTVILWLLFPWRDIHNSLKNNNQKKKNFPRLSIQDGLPWPLSRIWTVAEGDQTFMNCCRLWRQKKKKMSQRFCAAVESGVGYLTGSKEQGTAVLYVQEIEFANNLNKQGKGFSSTVFKKGHIFPADTLILDVWPTEL